MKNCFLLFLLITIAISCSDDTIDSYDQESVQIEKRRPCSGLYHDIPCSDDIANTLVGLGDENAIFGVGTSGVLDNILNCDKNFNTGQYEGCNRECTMVGLLGDYAGEGFIAEYDVCAWQVTPSFTAEEQQALVNQIVNAATIHAPWCDGERMIPISYDVVINFGGCCPYFDVEVTWVSECEQTTSYELLTP